MIKVKKEDKVKFIGSGIDPDFSYEVNRIYTVRSLERVEGNVVDAIRTYENSCWQYIKYFAYPFKCKYVCCQDDKKVCPFRENVER